LVERTNDSVDLLGVVCSPVFLPNPSDGSLYTFDVDEGVKKLPFTIPNLVNTAPCRSSDGRFLYMGWWHIDLSINYLRCFDAVAANQIVKNTFTTIFKMLCFSSVLNMRVVFCTCTCI